MSTLYTTHGFEPAYMALYRTGELRERGVAAFEKLRQCTLCPRCCDADRVNEQKGFCQTGRYALVSSYFPHTGEENCLRGTRGSGTIFFACCNLGCVFCQNFELSHGGEGQPVFPEDLARMMLSLQAQGCHNINCVTPTHAVPHILETLPLAIDQGLRLPLVYNTSAYDALDTLRLLDGVIDMYMPDFKFWDTHLAERYMQAGDYPERARDAVREMHHQVGDLVMDEQGIAQRGLLVRHLVMPGLLHDTTEVLRFLAEEISPDTYVNVMPQYRPAGNVSTNTFPEINRRTSMAEYAEALNIARQVGLRRLDER